MSKEALDLISETFSSREKGKEKQNLLSQFEEKITEIIWTYSPQVKQKNYSMNYAYPYLDPGIASTPDVLFKTLTGEVLIHVEGKFIKDTTPHVHPDSVKHVELSLRFKKGGKNSSLAVKYDKNTKPIEKTLPSVEKIKKGIKILNYLIEKYKALGTKEAPTGYCSDHY